MNEVAAPPNYHISTKHSDGEKEWEDGAILLRIGKDKNGVYIVVNDFGDGDLTVDWSGIANDSQRDLYRDFPQFFEGE